MSSAFTSVPAFSGGPSGRRRRRARRPAVSGAVAVLVAAALTVTGWGAAVPFAAAATTAAASPVGARPGATRLGFTLADRVNATVDVGTGNLQVSTRDLSLPGVGSDVELGLDFNSLLLGAGSPLPTGAAGRGWAMRLGADTRLLVNPDSSVLYLAPDGLEGLFTPGPVAGSYVSPPGFRSDLQAFASGGGWTLSEHASARVLTFNGAGRLTKVTDRNTNRTTFAYTADLLSSVTSTRGAAAARVATVTSNAYGLVTDLSQSDGAGSTRSVGYGYTNGRLTSLIDLLGRRTAFGYDTATGDLVSVTNSGGAVTQFGYTTTHQVNRVSQLNATVGSPGDSVTRLSYPSGTSTLVAGPTTDLAQTVAAVPHSTYTLDATDRVSSAVDPDGNSRAATYTPGFAVLSSTIGAGTTGSTSTGSYGANNGESLTGAAAPTGAAASLAYTNTATSSKFSPSGGTDSAGNAAAYAYDTAGNQNSVGNVALAATARVTYNPDGTVATATDPANGTNSTGYSTDALHQLTGITPVTGGSLGSRAFSYDTFGRLRTATDGAGRTTSYGYDLADRPLTVSYSDATPAVSYGYDPTGRLSSRTDASGTTSYGYDARNHLTSRANTNGGGTIGYGYDKAGQQVSLTDSRGTTRYTYSPAGLLASMTTAPGTLVLFGYDDHSRRTDTWDATNATHSTWAVHSHTSYDASGRATRVTADKGTGDASHTPVADLTYCYANLNADPTVCSTARTADRSLLQSSRDNLTGAVSTYRYDAGNRLTTVTVTGGPTPTSYAYTYDTNGNRLTATGTSPAAYNPANQVSNTGNTYDGAGNLTASPTLGSATYNAAGQMTAARTPAGGNGTYTYADRNQNELVSQTVPGGATIKYTYGRTDRNGLPQIEQVGLNGLYAYLEHDPTTGQPLAIRVTDGNEAFYISDGLSRPVGLVNAAGTTSTYAYDPYGVTTTTAGGSAAGQNPYRFAPGGLYDRTTGMLKYGQRWYQPTTGRFTQQDSTTHLADPRQGNKYAYAGDDPINNTDPTGASFLSAVVAVAGAVGFVAVVVTLASPVGAVFDVALAASILIGEPVAVLSIVCEFGSSC